MKTINYYTAQEEKEERNKKKEYNALRRMYAWIGFMVFWPVIAIGIYFLLSLIFKN